MICLICVLFEFRAALTYFSEQRPLSPVLRTVSRTGQQDASPSRSRTVGAGGAPPPGGGAPPPPPPPPRGPGHEGTPRGRGGGQGGRAPRATPPGGGGAPPPGGGPPLPRQCHAHGSTGHEGTLGGAEG